MNTNDPLPHPAHPSTSISMEDLSAGTYNFLAPLTPRKCPSDLWHKPKSTPIPVFGLHHQRSHSDTLCSVPDAVESLLSSSSDYWSNLRERMEQDKEQNNEIVSLVEEIHEKYNCEQGLFAAQTAVFMKVPKRGLPSIP